MSTIYNKSKWLFLREFYSLILRTFGSFFLMKIIGPAEFGIYASITGLSTFLLGISQMGVNIYLTKEDINKKELCQGFTLSVFTSVLVTIAYVAYVAFFSKDYKIFLILVSPAIILNGLKIVSMGLLEKNVEYKKISLIDLWTQISFYVFSFCLYKYGAIGLCIAYMISILYNTIHTFAVYPIPIRFCLPSKSMLKFGVGYTFSNFCWQTKNVINIVLLPILGPTNVGYISFATRLCNTANIVKDTTRRVSIKVLSGTNSNISNTLTYGILIQVFVVCSLMLGLVVSLPIIDKIMGKDWSSVYSITMYTACFTCIGAFFTVQSLYLTVINKNVVNGIYALIQSAIIILMSFLLYPQIGITAYGISLILASMSGIFIQVHFKNLDIKYRESVFYLFFFLVLIMLCNFYWWPPLLSIILLLVPSVRSLIIDLYNRMVKVKN